MKTNEAIRYVLHRVEIVTRNRTPFEFFRCLNRRVRQNSEIKWRTIFEIKLQLDIPLLRGISVRGLPNNAGPGERGRIGNSEWRK